jgi:hypothetical protein
VLWCTRDARSGLEIEDEDEDDDEDEPERKRKSKIGRDLDFGF